MQDRKRRGNENRHNKHCKKEGFGHLGVDIVGKDLENFANCLHARGGFGHVFEDKHPALAHGKLLKQKFQKQLELQHCGKKINK